MKTTYAEALEQLDDKTFAGWRYFLTRFDDLAPGARQAFINALINAHKVQEYQEADRKKDKLRTDTEGEQ